MRKSLFIAFILLVSTIGFMLKLPTVFRQYDKFLHSIFYFSIMILFTIVFKNWYLGFAVLLFLFGVAIEAMQSYSNRFFQNRIHGNFDVEDIIANTKGLIAGLFVIFLYKLLFRNK